MTRRERLTDEAIEAFAGAHAGWQRAGDALARTYAFERYGAAIGFAVQVAMAAEKRDHHPDLHVSWGKVRVCWTTHDAGGVTAFDAEMAALTDGLYAGA